MTHRNLTRAYELIKQFEGLSLQAYPDPATRAEPYTIGYGSTRYMDGTPVRLGDAITISQAEAMLEHDVQEFASQLETLLTWPTNTAQFCALVSLAYNIGIGALRRSTLLKLHNAGNHASAAEQFMRWTRAAGRELPGLVRRRAAERELYLQPEHATHGSLVP